MKINFIVPPVRGGVTDFADVLSARLSEKYEVTIFTWSGQMSGPELDLALNADYVCLQYSGYGYANRGVPFWLLRALRQRRGRIKHLCVFFHELYAFEPFWSSAFWYSPFQRYTVASLARLSDAWLTNRQASADWLRARTTAKPNAVLPVFSNVGEAPVGLTAGRDRIVVFGGAALRAATYRAAGSALFQWANERGLTVHDLGPDLQDVELSQCLKTNGVVCHGRLSAEAVSTLLVRCQYGVLAYHSAFMAKSGSLAAYCAHGVVPLIFNEGHCERDGLRVGVNCLQGLPAETIDADKRAALSQAAWAWYQPHGVQAHVNVLLGILHSFEHEK
jgi:hypothetical protein